jgi:hypothetical protein
LVLVTIHRYLRQDENLICKVKTLHYGHGVVMSLTFMGNRLIGSNTFRFLVGPDQTPCNIHAELAIHLSPVFSTLIAGHMSESLQQCAVLGDIDADIFLRFCEFAYTGDYPVPEAIAIEEHSRPQDPRAHGGTEHPENIILNPECQVPSEKPSSKHNSKASLGYSKLA